MNKEEIIQSAINLNPDNLTGSDAKVLCEYICNYVLLQNQIISNEQDIKDRTKDTLLLLSFLSEIRNVFFEKAKLYRQNLIDLYTTELSKIKGFTTLPEKHSMYIKNNYEFRKIALASVIDVQEQFVLSWTGNNTYDWNELDEKYTKELNLLRLKIQQYERNLYVQQKSDTKVKLPINSIKRAIDDNETLGADNTTLQNSLSHFQLLKEEIDLTKQIEVEPLYKKNFDIDVQLLKRVYDLCSDDIFTCEEIAFYNHVATADFSKLTALKSTKVHRMIFYLSKIMNKDWYIEAVKSIGKTKNDCSSSSVSDYDYWRCEFEKIDKRFDKAKKHLQ